MMANYNDAKRKTYSSYLSAGRSDHMPTYYEFYDMAEKIEEKITKEIYDEIIKIIDLQGIIRKHIKLVFEQNKEYINGAENKLKIMYDKIQEDCEYMVIYGLYDPRDLKLKYVGKTSDGLMQRYHSHVRKDGGNKLKNEWIDELLSLKLKPIIAPIEYTLPSLANEREKYWISIMNKEEELFNIQGIHWEEEE